MRGAGFGRGRARWRTDQSRRHRGVARGRPARRREWEMLEGRVSGVLRPVVGRWPVGGAGSRGRGLAGGLGRPTPWRALHQGLSGGRALCDRSLRFCGPPPARAGSSEGCAISNSSVSCQNAALARSLESSSPATWWRPPPRSDELPDEMREAVRGASRALAALIQQIQSSSVEVAAAAGTVQRTSSELASASSQQAAAVVEITASTEELARTAGQIAANSAVQAELAARPNQQETQVPRSVEAAVAGVDAVRQHMDAISGSADTLGSRSREIYRVLDLITEIAQETHILSLERGDRSIGRRRARREVLGRGGGGAAPRRAIPGVG